jgi:hypothetical protein
MSTNKNALAPPRRFFLRPLVSLLAGTVLFVALLSAAVALGLLATTTILDPQPKPQEVDTYTTVELWREVNRHLQKGTLDQLAEKQLTVTGVVCSHIHPIPASPKGYMAISRDGDAETEDRVAIWLDEGELVEKGSEVMVRGVFFFDDASIILRHGEIIRSKPPPEN